MCWSKSIRAITRSPWTRRSAIAGGRPGHRAVCGHQRSGHFGEYIEPGFVQRSGHRECAGRHFGRAAAISTPRSAQLVQAQANDVKAQNDLVRYKQLVDKQEISQQLYDQAVAAAAAGDAAASRRQKPRMRPPRRSRLRRRKAGWSLRRQAWRSSQTGPQQVAVHRGPRKIGRCRRARKAGGTRASQAESAVHENPGAGGRRGDQERRSGHERAAGPATASVFGARRCLDHREFQGNAAEKHAPRTSARKSRWTANGRRYKGHVDSIAGSSGARTQPASAGKRHRELREGRAACPRENRPRPRRKRGSLPALWNVRRTQSLL